MVFDDELDHLARAHGLGLAATHFREDLQKALAAARNLKDELPREFRLADEPAHILRLKAGGGR